MLVGTWVEGVSVIVTTNNAASALPGFFEHLHEVEEVLEVLVCDCGSTDDTIAIARQAGAHVYRGRGTPSSVINNAIRHARGSALWFLSAYARPPKHAASYILGAIEDEGFGGGHFPIRLFRQNWARPWVAWRANLSAQFWGNLRMEHGFFVDRECFERTGDNYPDGEAPLAEMRQRVQSAGRPLITMPEAIHVAS